MQEANYHSIAGNGLMSPDDLSHGLASLSRGAYFGEASLDMMLSILAESAATICGVERASIWALTAGQRELRCLELFERTAGLRGGGNSIDAIGHPVFFQALREGRCLAVDDAYAHPMLAEFVSYYLPRHRITALLATPVFIRGDWQGLLLLEQVGTRQAWAGAHQIFAQAVANLVALALVEYEAGEARSEAQRAKEQVRAVIDASPDAILLADGRSGQIIDANRQAESLTGRTRADLLGRHHGSLYPVEQQGAMASALHRLGEERREAKLAAEVERTDGIKVLVEIRATLADLSDGSRLALKILRAA